MDRFHGSWSWVFIFSGCGFILPYFLMILSDYHRVPQQRGGKVSTISILKTSFFIALLFSMVTYVVMEAGISYFIDSLLVTEYDSNFFSTWTISGFWLFMAISRFLFASIRMKPRIMVLLGFISSAAILFILYFIRSQ
jgi:hypothetical protein